MHNNIIGIDIGGTKTAMGLVSPSGKLISKVEFETGSAKSFQNIIDEIIGAFKKLKAKEVDKIGIGIAGQIDSDNGIVVHSPNIPQWKNIPVVKTLERKLSFEFKKKKDFKVKIGNDANCFTLAESIYGAGKGFKNIVGVTLGTGIGGGLIMDGKLYLGQGYASEPGHMIINCRGRKCSCGKEGCLETYASGSAIEEDYFKKTKTRKKASEVEEEAIGKGGKNKAYLVYEKAGQYLGIGISNLVNILDPDMVVIGGGLGCSNLLFNIARREALKNIFFKKRKVEIKKAKLGRDAGIIGAAELVR